MPDTLLILTPGFAASEADTNCLPMQQGLVRVLKENYPDLNIVVLAFQYPYFKRTYNWYNATVISFNGKNKGGVSRIIRAREITAVLKKIHRTNKIIGLLSFWLGECAAVGKQFATDNGLRHYCWLLGQDAREGNKYVRYIKPEAAELIALSDSLQAEFEQHYGIRPVHVIPSGIDVKQLPAATESKTIDILGAGSLIPLKQFDLFVEVVASIKKRLPGVKAVLAGDGPEKEKLIALIKQHDLTDNLTLTGEIPHRDLLTLMARSKLLLHPSSYEGFSGVCQEALAMGMQVISFCRAMKEDIEQWHIVRDQKEMQERTLEVFVNNKEHNSVILYSTDVIAEIFIDLFTD